MEKNALAQARKTFEDFCQVLDHQRWSYNRDEEALSAACTVRLKDVSADITATVDPEHSLIVLRSYLPLTVPEDNVMDVIIALCAINHVLFNGDFRCDIDTGRIYFNMTNSFADSTLGKEVYVYLLSCSCQMLDAYSGKLERLLKGTVSVEQFLADICN